MPLPYARNLKEPSRELRRSLTDAEQRIWSRVRRKQLLGIQFYRQRPIGPYIVDFYAPAVKLAVELDGSQHLEPGHSRRDAERDAFLAEMGITVVRFSNIVTLSHTDAVMEEVFRVCAERVGERKANPP